MPRNYQTLPRIAAECFPPGEFLREEMEALGWSPESLATMLKWQQSVIDGLLAGTVEIDEQMARDLEAGFGVSGQYWLNLEYLYRKWLRRSKRRSAPRSNDADT